ncbi:amino acid adenylation domain-containing protein [Clostridiaceae bacterium M8S5]|nr:amino acid adenylation domain-containing protein [Clostridiaceae bacterium M8S5]
MNNKNNSEKIAIIGLGCRFPGGINDPISYWNVLESGTDCITEIPKSRWDLRSFYNSSKENPGKINTMKGGYIEGIDEFDPTFFGISPREAHYMDPQQRKALEVAWEALEDAGLKAQELAGEQVGVFMGAFTLDYKLLQYGGSSFDGIAAHTPTGVMMTMISNRISYVFDFKGPSLSIDTACSSSLVATHLACESLKNGESNLALAGGAGLQFAPQYTISECKGGFLSPNGWSHGFDKSANGYVRSEGVGIVVLKRLSDAIKDKDNIYAVIIGNGSNQDGHSNGITVPNPQSQIDLMVDVCQKAGIKPNTIQYVEAHGTGTPVGDPIEANSIGQVLSIERDKKDKCFIGSVKTNFGHTEAAAGVAGLIKTALSLKNKKIPPHLHLKEINPKIEMDKWSFEIPSKLEEWPKHSGKARASVNSFGFGGTNAHVILEEAPIVDKVNTENEETTINRPKIFPLSAKNKDVFSEMALKYNEHIAKMSIEELMDVCYTLSHKRQHLDYRLGLVYNSKADLLEKLSLCADEKENPMIVKGRKLSGDKVKLVWVFTGMGPQWWAMGRKLYETEPVYREMMDKCDKEMRKWVDWSLVEEMNASQNDSNMTNNWLSQPANFALQLALSKLLRHYGIKPDALIGHSTGEAAAFYEAGVYTFEDAVKVIMNRSRLQQKTSGTGKMLAVGLNEEDALNLIKPYGDSVSIAAINSPSAVTLAGKEESLEAIAKKLEVDGVFAKFLKVKIPYHSPCMDMIKDELFEDLENIKPMKAKIRLYSTALGKEVDGTELDAGYWWKNVRGSVYFAKAFTKMLQDGYSVFLEVGPHPVLKASMSECGEREEKDVKLITSLKRKEDDLENITLALSQLFISGFVIDWDKLYKQGNFVHLPNYTWKKDKYWVEPFNVERKRLGYVDHHLLGYSMRIGSYAWENSINSSSAKYLKDHLIQGNVVFPAAGYIEMGFAALDNLVGGGNYSIEKLEFKKALFLSENKDKKVQFFVSDKDSSFKIISYDEENDNKDIHCSGILKTIQNTSITSDIDISSLTKNMTQSFDKEECYNKLNSMGYEYGYYFQGIEKIWLSEEKIISKICINDELYNEEESYFHPTITDACFQTFVTTEFLRDESETGEIRLPVSIEKIRLTNGYKGEIWVVADIKENTAKNLVGSIYIYNNKGEAIGEIKNFSAKALDQVSSNVSLNRVDTMLYDLKWEEKEFEKNEQEISVNKNELWVVFGDGGGLADEISNILSDKGYGYLNIRYADTLKIDEDLNYIEIPRNDKKALNNIFDLYFKQKNYKCKKILHLENTNLPDLDNCTIDDIEKAKTESSYSIIQIANLIVEYGIKGKLTIITRGSQRIGFESNMHPLAAPAWGLGRVLYQQELTENFDYLIDLDLEEELAKNDAKNVFEIVTMDKTDDKEIVVRNDSRYIPKLMLTDSVKKPIPLSFNKDGIHIITGAFGALGKLVSKKMALHGATKLVLVGRSEIPERRDWKKVSDSSVLAKINFIKELESMGVQVICKSVDMSSENQVSQFAQELKDLGYPPVRTIVHSAGIVKDTVISEMDIDSFSKVYDTKVYGGYLLNKYFSEETVENFIVFSSVACILTATGQTNYGAANAFLNALSSYRQMNGQPALAINWGPWAVGMIKKLNLGEFYKNNRGMDVIAPEVGMKVFERLMGQDVTQMMVCDVEWDKALLWYPKPISMCEHLIEKDSMKDSGDDENFENVFINSEPSERKVLVLNGLSETIAGILKCDVSQVASDASLSVLGVDSIMATELRNKISSNFGYMFKIVTLLSNTTIAELSNELYKDISERLSDVDTQNANSKDEQDDNIQVIDKYSLSYGQKALWFLYQLNPESSAYNIAGVLYIPVELNIEAINKSVEEIVKRHEQLRTNFFIEDGEPCQKIYEYRNEYLTHIDAQGKDKEAILNMIVENTKEPFNLERGPLYRFTLYKQSEKDYYLSVNIHHIVSDAWSNYMFINEIQAFYAKFALNKEVALKEIDTSYKDYIFWENEKMNSLKGTKMFNFWKNNLPKDIPILNIPTDKVRPVVQTNNGTSYSFTIDAELTEKLVSVSKQNGATLFMTLLSSFYTLLYKYSGQKDVIIGSPVSGRTQPEFSNVYGYFVNPLPLWANFDEDPTFKEFLGEVKENVLMALENQDYPFALLLEKLGLKRDPSRSAIFQVMFVYLMHNIERTGFESGNVGNFQGFPMQVLSIPEEEGQFDITLSMYEENGILHATFKYNTDLFYESTIVRMSKHFKELMSKIVESPDLNISKYSVLTDDERKMILTEWNGNIDENQKEETVHQLIEKISLENPQKVAITVPYEDKSKDSITYEELNKKSNQIARYLRDKGVTANTPVIVCMKKSVDMAIVLIGIMKSGGAYVPIEANWPEDRINYAIENSKSLLMIYDSNNDFKEGDFSIKTVSFAEMKNEAYRLDDSTVESINSIDDMAYIVYTSGSLGKPKGVMVCHKNVVSIYKSWEETYELKKDEYSHLQMASFSFDVFSGDLVRALCSGGKLVLCRKEVLLNIPLLYDIMIEEGVNIGEFVPAIIRNMMNYIKKDGKKLDFMKILIVGSDVWNMDEYRELKLQCSLDTRVISSYGLTEATIDSTYYEPQGTLTTDGAVPIGKPFANTEIYILDNEMNPVPVGIPGEIYIGGDGVTLGYVNAPELTKERFINHSFDKTKQIRLYKTGDLALWNNDGNIKMLQRIDNQVKIRGHRIELSEIEKQLESIIEVEKAFVVPKEAPNGEKLLCAYCKAPASLDINKTNKYLKKKLPTYMIPSYMLRVEEFPLTNNGKVDIKKLPVPTLEKEIQNKPQTENEKKLAKLWSKLLGIRRIDLNDDFFDLGGNSLNLVELMILIRQEFDINISVNKLFSSPSLYSMASVIDSITAKEIDGDQIYGIYNEKGTKTIFGFPPAGGYSIVYKNIAYNMPHVRFVSFNYIENDKKIEQYADMIYEIDNSGRYTLFGYSLGGNLAFEVGRELERRGYEVLDVIIMDSYRINGSFEISDADMKKFEIELSEHFKKHTGSDIVHKHTMKQAKEYIDFCYSKKNLEDIKAIVHFIVEENPESKHRDFKIESWKGSSTTKYNYYQGIGKHADMLDESKAKENVKILEDIIG